jgi:hypothetical protein
VRTLEACLQGAPGVAARGGLVKPLSLLRALLCSHRTGFVATRACLQVGNDDSAHVPEGICLIMARICAGTAADPGGEAGGSSGAGVRVRDPTGARHRAPARRPRRPGKCTSFMSCASCGRSACALSSAIASRGLRLRQALAQAVAEEVRGVLLMCLGMVTGLGPCAAADSRRVNDLMLILDVLAPLLTLAQSLSGVKGSGVGGELAGQVNPPI